MILGSLRRPVKIGIVGSNAKSYKYLMKFGEDLRQDERIESLFEAANSTLDANPETRKRGMRIKTYKVRICIYCVMFIIFIVYTVYCTQ